MFGRVGYSGNSPLPTGRQKEEKGKRKVGAMVATAVGRGWRTAACSLVRSTDVGDGDEEGIEDSKS